MKLSEPQYRNLKFESAPDLADGHEMFDCDMLYTGYISPPTEEHDYLVIGAKFKIIFYVHDEEDEVASYLGEVQSVVLECINPEEDKEMLMFLSKKIVKYFVAYFSNKVPYVDVDYIPIVHKQIVDFWGERLVAEGLYNV